MKETVVGIMAEDEFPVPAFQTPYYENVNQIFDEY